MEEWIGSKTAKKKKKKIDLGPEYRDPKNARHRISFWMDGDLLAELKKRTDVVGAGYQAYTHKLLRDVVMEKDSIEERLFFRRDELLKAVFR